MDLGLKRFHLVFILCAMIVLDLFGFWGMWHYPESGEGAFLFLGVAGLVGSLALAAYALIAVLKFDREHVP
jgi:hypothetical protein